LGGAKPEPGRDYVLSEVVHCKSRDRIGVREAVGQCTGRWLARVLAAAGAVVVVVLGEDAGAAVREHLGLVKSCVHHAEASGRHFLFLPAPGSDKRRRISNCIDSSERATLRAKVAQMRPAGP
jgi:hypothetical protein